MRRRVVLEFRRASTPSQSRACTLVAIGRRAGIFSGVAEGSFFRRQAFAYVSAWPTSVVADKTALSVATNPRPAPLRRSRCPINSRMKAANNAFVRRHKLNFDDQRITDRRQSIFEQFHPPIEIEGPSHVHD
jgi:hypothetical protein